MLEVSTREGIVVGDFLDGRGDALWGRGVRPSNERKDQETDGGRTYTTELGQKEAPSVFIQRGGGGGKTKLGTQRGGGDN